LKLWGDKYPEYVFQLDELNTLYPNARFVLVVRNPVSVTASLIKRRFVALGENANKVNLNEYRIGYADCWKQWVCWNELIVNFAQRLDPARVLFIRYEDMLEDSAVVFGALSDFIGLDLNDDPGSGKVIQGIRPERAFDVPDETLNQIRLLSDGFTHPLCSRFSYEALQDGVVR
jgi:Sulfotransferase family